MEKQAQPVTSRKHCRGRCPDGSANPVDVYVGQRISIRRQMLHFSQMELAQKLGLTFQQIQKYEKGTNRISASRLWDISQILGVEINYFFQDMSRETANKSPRMIIHHLDNQENILLNTPFEVSNTAQQLLLNYSKIHQDSVAQAVFDLLKVLSRSD